MIKVVKASPFEKKHFAALMLLSAPEFFPELFGKRWKDLLEKLFIKTKNLFSFEHTIFAVYKENIAGMILSYGWREKHSENLKTGLYMLYYLKSYFIKKFRTFLSINKLNDFEQNGYYISNLAVYPNSRGKGIGTRLLETIENQAKAKKYSYLILDVETANNTAIKLYKKFGFDIVRKFQITLRKTFCFYRMIKSVNST